MEEGKRESEALTREYNSNRGLKYLTHWMITTATLGGKAALTVFYNLPSEQVELTEKYLAKKLAWRPYEGAKSIAESFPTPDFELKWSVSLEKKNTLYSFQCEAELKLILYSNISRDEFRFPVSLTSKTVKAILKDLDLANVIPFDPEKHLRSTKIKRKLEEAELRKTNSPQGTTTTEDVTTLVVGISKEDPNDVLDFFQKMSNLLKKRLDWRVILGDSRDVGGINDSRTLLERLKRVVFARLKPPCDKDDIKDQDIKAAFGVPSLFVELVWLEFEHEAARGDKYIAFDKQNMDEWFSFDKYFSTSLQPYTLAILRELQMAEDSKMVSRETRENLMQTKGYDYHSCVKHLFVDDPKFHKAFLYLQLHLANTIVVKHFFSFRPRNFYEVAPLYLDYLLQLYYNENENENDKDKEPSYYNAKKAYVSAMVNVRKYVPQYINDV